MEGSMDYHDGQIWSNSLKNNLCRVSSAEVLSLTQRESFAFIDSKPPKFSTIWNDEENFDQLFRAVCEGDLQYIQEIKMSSSETNRALNLACKKDFNHGEVIKILLSSRKIPKLPKVEFQNNCVPLLHFASICGCVSSVKALVNNEFVKVNLNEGDQDHWRPLHYSVSQRNHEISRFLLENGADPNAEGLYKMCPLHIAAYKEDIEMVHLLLDFGANPKKFVSVNAPRYSFSFEDFNLERKNSRILPLAVFYNSRVFSTLLHWAVVKGSTELVQKMIEKGSSIDTHDIEGFTPLGLALTEGKSEMVKYFGEIGVELSDEDKNWRRIKNEEMGLRVVNILERTTLDEFDCSNKEGFSLLHLAASYGFLNLLNRLLSLGVNPNLETCRGETPLFYAVESNQQACMQQLLKAGGNIFHISKKKSSILHTAAKFNNFAAIDEILSRITKDKKLDVNMADEKGFTAIYYAINKGRYDIVQRFVQYCVSNSIHVKATQHETLLQFYTERNILDQYDNNIVRVLELEKALHKSKTSAEKCIRLQLGTTYASTKAREQLQAMYDSTDLQLNFWYVWLTLSCFLLPSALYFLDVYTDVVLAVEYLNDYIEISGQEDVIKRPFELMFRNITESQSKINFTLTVFFLLCPMIFLGIWNFYIHLTQQDIFPGFNKMPRIQRGILYFFLFTTPLGPIVSFMENTYAQIHYMTKTSEISVNHLDEDASVIQPSGDRLREYYNLKHVSQMRVAINNVMEASLESAFQLVLQLYILGTQYNDLKQLHFGDITLGSILSLSPTNDSETRLSKQVLSVLISLVSLTWSFTAYHRFSKLGGLRILWSLPLLFAIFFQIISRAIACTVFTLAYTWRIFVVLGVHYLIVFIAKVMLEKKTQAPRNFLFGCSYIRPYFYVILGTFTSTFVYFRIQRPQEERDYISPRHSSFFIQTFFLVLAFVENVVLFGVGLSHLEYKDYDSVFRIVSGILFMTSFIIGVVLQYVYYACFGHPWVNINGPSVEKMKNGDTVISFYKEGGETQCVIHSCRSCSQTFVETVDDYYMPSKSPCSSPAIIIDQPAINGKKCTKNIK
ncbi:putative ankyrin repeat protein [Armadillidium nasatum]|uniref:XK-related protein n=1 Tax=Armadillidium nasatum TaxID=96803 RepID=A0A5N5SP10_9CRUS|nr:putative ankyrin repeat protein [Armadillidium nasatum]